MSRIHDKYVMRKMTPGIWFLEARRLKVGGDLLYDAYKKDLDLLEKNGNPLLLKNLELGGVATMIFGLAIEALLKAIILSKTHRFHKGHKLIELSKNAGITLTDVQRDIVERLKAHIEWSGRYPVPLKSENMLLDQRATNRPFFPMPLQPDERPIFNELYDQLEKSVA